MEDNKYGHFITDSLLFKSMTNKEKLFLSSGKKLRSLLIDIIAEGVSYKEVSTLDVLKNVTEEIHNATLIHDDVIDESDFRRDMPSFRSTKGNHQSILIGDFLLAKAFHSLSFLENSDLIKSVSKVLGELVEGEWIQYDYRQKKYESSFELHRTIARNKTGSLFAWCFQSVQIVSGSTYELASQSDLGHELGYLYQIYDDIQDFSQTSKKTLHSDLMNEELNFVILNYNKSAKKCWSEAIKMSVEFLNFKVDQLIQNCHEEIGTDSNIALMINRLKISDAQKFSIPQDLNVPILSKC